MLGEAHVFARLTLSAQGAKKGRRVTDPTTLLLLIAVLCAPARHRRCQRRGLTRSHSSCTGTLVLLYTKLGRRKDAPAVVVEAE